MKQPTEHRVSVIVSNQLGIMVSDIKASDRLVTDLGADSLDLVEMVMAVEYEFDIDISDSELTSCGTVGDMIAIVGKKGGK